MEIDENPYLGELYEQFEKALERDDFPVVQILLELGLDPSWGLDYVTTTEMADLLLEHGADPTMGLPQAIAWNDHRLVRLLLEAEGNPHDGDLRDAWFVHQDPYMRELLTSYGVVI